MPQQQQHAVRRAAEDAVKMALFHFGGEGQQWKKQQRGRPQWQCPACGWDNDLRRRMCRHCGVAKLAAQPQTQTMSSHRPSQNAGLVPPAAQPAAPRGVWAASAQRSPVAVVASAKAAALEQAAAAARRAGAVGADALAAEAKAARQAAVEAKPVAERMSR
eukprot:7055015-Karenia_brevis.AAC.1